MYENRVYRRIFGPRRDEVRWDWRKLHNEEINDLYCSPNIFSGDQIENNEMGWACSTDVESRGVYRTLVRKP